MRTTPAFFALLLFAALNAQTLGGFSQANCDSQSPAVAFMALDETLSRILGEKSNSTLRLLHFSSQVVAGSNLRVVLEAKFDAASGKATKHLGFVVFVPLPSASAKPSVTKMVVDDSLEDVLAYLKLTQADVMEQKCTKDIKLQYKEAHGARSGAAESKEMRDADANANRISGVAAVMANLDKLMERFKKPETKTPAESPKKSKASIEKSAPKVETKLADEDVPFISTLEFKPDRPTIESLVADAQKPDTVMRRINKTQESIFDRIKEDPRANRPGSFETFMRQMPLASFPSMPSLDGIFAAPNHTSMPSLNSKSIFSHSSSYATSTGDGYKHSTMSYMAEPDEKDPSKVRVKGTVVEDDNGRKTTQVIDSDNK